MLLNVMSSTVTSAAVAAAAPQGPASRGGRAKFGPLFGKKTHDGRSSIRSGRSTVKSTTVVSRALPDDAEISHQSSSSASSTPSLGRRSLLSQGSAAALVASLYAQQGGVAHAGEVTDNKMVGAYLPEAEGEPGFNVFTAGPTRTPALRAGALEPYQVLLPSTWKEAPVSNARSGNYCQPRCDEATTEVQFVDPNMGRRGDYNKHYKHTSSPMCPTQNPTLFLREPTHLLKSSPKLSNFTVVAPSRVLKNLHFARRPKDTLRPHSSAFPFLSLSPHCVPVS